MSNETNYDSSADTLFHIREVARNITFVVQDLMTRAMHHDDSKLKGSEKDLFDIYTPKLKNVTYGSEEYNRFLAELRSSLDHHYANNRHHPEHYPDGIKGMNLIDLVEMLCDWQASCKRHNDGNLLHSLEINKKRFNMSDDLYQILKNTVEYIDNTKK